MEDNKNHKGAAPKAPLCCLPFGTGKDFYGFWCISGALLDLQGPAGIFIKILLFLVLVGAFSTSNLVFFLFFMVSKPLLMVFHGSELPFNGFKLSSIGL